MGLHKYTVAESNNLGLGQAGSEVYTNHSATYNPPSGMTIIAIQALTGGVAFDLLTPETGHLSPSSAAAGSGTNGAAWGTTIVLTTGSTIYGRWSAVSLNAADQAVLCYFG